MRTQDDKACGHSLTLARNKYYPAGMAACPPRSSCIAQALQHLSSGPHWQAEGRDGTFFVVFIHHPKRVELGAAQVCPRKQVGSRTQPNRPLVHVMLPCHGSPSDVQCCKGTPWDGVVEGKAKVGATSCMAISITVSATGQGAGQQAAPPEEAE
eukprot:404588-Amphidinium_carterae.1